MCGASRDRVSAGYFTAMLASRMTLASRCVSSAIRLPKSSGVLPHTPMVVERGKLKLKLHGKFSELAGERLFNRLRQLARLIGREPVMETGRG